MCIGANVHWLPRIPHFDLLHEKRALEKNITAIFGVTYLVLRVLSSPVIRRVTVHASS